jgi:hypothetical protein
MRGRPQRVRDVVYVVGAGFSAGLGYPLTKSLLIDVWQRLPSQLQKRMAKIIQFHHPDFDPARTTSFPDIEQLLTEIAVNLDLFEASRRIEGRFKRGELEDARDSLLWTIAEWFHEIHKTAQSASWLAKFRRRLVEENAAIVSFNWDLVLDSLLFRDQVPAVRYGLTEVLGDGPILLKPHGSLNWYESSAVEHVPSAKRTVIFESTGEDVHERVDVFRFPRAIKSKVGNRYSPLLVPPTFLKDFRRPIFRRLWKNCTDVLSTPKTLVFLGYSLPMADLHAQFIFRCGFHNQIEGRLGTARARYPATGAADVTIVNPDQSAARRIESVAGPKISCRWVPTTVEGWLKATI